MNLAIVLYVVLGVLLAFTLVYLIRNTMVYRLRRRLLAEEGGWQREHSAEISDGRRRRGIFERDKRLPPYEVMVLKFWRTMDSFERELGPVAQYYPLVEKDE